jgi:hypothetical protein
MFIEAAAFNRQLYKWDTCTDAVTNMESSSNKYVQQ